MSAAARPLPLYARVKHHLATRIANGEWPEDARLPSEHELMALLGASRMTVHRALREMAAEGVLRRVQGLGTFVHRPRPRAALLEITDMAEDITRRGGTHAARIITLETIQADAALATIFALRRGARLYHSLIIHSENGTPLQLEERYVTPLFAPLYLQQDFTAQTTTNYLQAIAPPAGIEHEIHAIRPDPRTCRLLHLEPGEPCLELRRRTWTAAGPATYSILTHPGGRYSFAGRADFPPSLG